MTLRDWRNSFFRHYTFVDYATQLYQLLVVVLVVLFHNSTVQNWWLVAGLHLVAMAVTHWLVKHYASSPSNKVIGFLRHFYPVLFYTWFFTETGRLNRMFFTEYMDPLVIRWDQYWFGCQPSVLFMHRLPYLPLSELFYLSYFSYYIMISGIGIALYLRNRAQFFHYVSVVSFVFYVCYTIYIFIPVIGPRVFFREIHGYDLPDDIQALAPTDTYPANLKVGPFFQIMAWVYRNFESPGAAIPSSHVAIALCTLFFSYRYLPKIRGLHTVMVALLCLSTVYCRYHYVMDVVAGVGTAALLVPLGNWLFRKLHSPEAAAQTATSGRQTITAR